MSPEASPAGTLVPPPRRRAAAVTLVGQSANTVIVTAQALVLIPLYLHYIGAGLYGAWVATGGLLVWFQVLDLGFPNLLIQRVGAALGRGDSREARDYFYSGTLIIVVVAAVLVAIGAGLASWLPSWMGVEGEDASLLRSAFLVGLLASGLGLASNAFVGLGRALQDTGLVMGGLVVGSALGFGTTLGTLVGGLGLWAIPVGIAARSIVVFGVGLIFSVRALRRLGDGRPGRVRGSLVREYLTVAPPSGIGTVAYGAMGQGETTLIALLLGTDAGLVYNLTRRAADTVNGVVDTIGFGSYGGFAHLVGSGEVDRARKVARELSSLRLSVSIALLAVVLACNRSFISLWVGEEYYGGNWLTLAVVLQLIVVGQSYLYNTLYRASGPVLRGSVALSMEGVLRFGGAAALLVAGVGLEGVPLIGVGCGLGFTWLYWSWVLQGAAEREGEGSLHRPAWLLWTVRVGLLGLALGSSRMMTAGSWLWLVVFCLLWTTLAGLAVWRADRTVGGAVQGAFRLLGRGSSEAP